MKIADLNNYVKFVFDLKDKSQNFVTTDIDVLKECVPVDTLKVGDIFKAFEGEHYKVVDIYVKDILDYTRDENYGFNLQHGQPQGKIKESLLTIVVTLELQND
ncbi:hypothetical protein [Aquimarina sp. RZ0]|uniref:hypothetical protein n=1 Tax=Aquimarina sp. RZ0 TaxID=2607730 RepID=UPI0011F177A7|nr:hypothetical protein [Aquimarina sp. RZ0]KAA1242530.1 hypothetical protein F0000_25185 [Aquimarina sp. RZ0]KAA1242539.1 hypothetical protein F0000_25230 [Aquimarina sp. RZ0]